jgi:hypothetical protein
MARDVRSPKRRTREKTKKFYGMARVFADLYGFLGFFREAFAPPVLPPRADWLFSHVTPDALIDQCGELRVIDPATEGKRLLEDLLHDRWECREGLLPSGERLTLDRRRVTSPNELRFPELRLDAGEFGLIEPSSEWRRHSRARSYEEVRELFGIRFVLDEHTPEGVSVVATREPLEFWRRELVRFQPAPSGAAYFDNMLEGVTPRAVDGDGGGLDSSWRCPSLLKAIYLMLYLDKTVHGVKLHKCQAPGCPEYYRVGPRSRESLYCPSPPGRKQSRCASRASSQMYRERQRRSPGTT